MIKHITYSVLLLTLVLCGCSRDKRPATDTVGGGEIYTNVIGAGIPKWQKMFFDEDGGTWEYTTKWKEWALAGVIDGPYGNLGRTRDSHVTYYNKRKWNGICRVHTAYYDSPTCTLSIYANKIRLRVKPLGKNEESRRIIFNLSVFPGCEWYIEVQQSTMKDFPPYHEWSDSIKEVLELS